jgi:hypothetical protein
MERILDRLAAEPRFDALGLTITQLDAASIMVTYFGPPRGKGIGAGGGKCEKVSYTMTLATDDTYVRSSFVQGGLRDDLVPKYTSIQFLPLKFFPLEEDGVTYFDAEKSVVVYGEVPGGIQTLTYIVKDEP